jgi:hypothetical protein
VLTLLTNAHAWLGLKNSDDQGTRFDLRAQVYVNANLVTSGLTRCITGVTRNPARALEAVVAFDPFVPIALGPGDEVSVKLSTRIGTNPNGTKCPGHNNAVGLRLYYDGAERPSRINATIAPDPPADYFLRTTSSDVLDPIPPTASSPQFKDSPSLNFAGGNPWKDVGMWSRTMP